MRRGLDGTTIALLEILSVNVNTHGVISQVDTHGVISQV